jgi:hypothetical protein
MDLVSFPESFDLYRRMHIGSHPPFPIFACYQLIPKGIRHGLCGEMLVSLRSSPKVNLSFKELPKDPAWPLPLELSSKAIPSFLSWVLRHLQRLRYRESTCREFFLLATLLFQGFAPS